MEACRKVGDMLLMWELKSALEEIKTICSLSTLSPSEPYAFTNIISSTLSYLLNPSSFFVTVYSSPILQTPFYHYKLGSLRHINQTISYIIKMFHLRSSNIAQSFDDELFHHFVDQLDSTGFSALSEHLWCQQRIEGCSIQRIIAKLISNVLPYVDEIHQIIGSVNIIPLSSRLDVSFEILQLKIKYKIFTKFMKDQEWDDVITFISDHPLTLLTPYFWDDCDVQKHSPLEVAFACNAPYKILEFIVRIGGLKVINGAYNTMHKIYPFHRACMDQDVEVLRLLVDIAGSDILCTVNHGKTSLRTPLQMALNYKNKAAIRFLLLEGGRKALNINTKKGQLSPIICACINEFECPVDIVQDLLAVGGTDMVYSKGHFGFTPLHYALHSTKPLNEKLIELLVNKGGKQAVLSHDEDKKTPLHLACRTASIKIIRSLIAVGGETAIHATSLRTMETPVLNALLALRFDVAQLLLKSSVVSPLKIGQDKIDSLLGLFVETERRTFLKLKGYAICISFILEHSDVNLILHSLFQHFDYGIAFAYCQRPIMAMISRLGNDTAWELVLPHLVRSLKNSSSFLHTIIKLLTAGTLYLGTSPAVEVPQCIMQEQQNCNHASYRDYVDRQDCVFLMKETMNMFPETVRMYDEEGRLPLHVACEKGLPYEILRGLLDIYPNAVWDSDRKTGLPFIALAATGYDSYSLKCDFDLDTIFMLLKEHPSCAIANQ